MCSDPAVASTDFKLDATDAFFRTAQSNATVQENAVMRARAVLVDMEPKVDNTF